MGYANTIKGNVRKAFNMVGDLAVNATLTRNANTGYDFATASVKTPTTTSKVVKAILITKRRQSADKLSSSLQTSFLMKAEDVPDPTVYDTLTVSAGISTAVGTWRMVPPYENDGYLITVNCAKEA